MTIKQVDGESSPWTSSGKEETIEQAYPGMGLQYEVDAVARLVREGKLEYELLPHEKTLLVMEIVDEARRQGGYIFPEGMEQIV